MTDRILIVTAVAAEADSVARGLAGEGRPDALPGGYALRRHTTAVPVPTASGGPAAPAGAPSAVDVLVAGVGPAAAAAATATALARAALDDAPYGLVVSAGIAGGFAPHAPLGSVVVSDALVAADLGAQTPDGYLPVEDLGFGRSAHRVPPALLRHVADVLDAGGIGPRVGPVLTVSTVTGTAARAAELARRHPGAVAEAMEGFGVAEAAAAHGLPVIEIRAVSNAVGPRDRAAWRIGEALAALTHAFRLLAGGPAPGDLAEPAELRKPK
ncbi:futalosine hydrolase [Streptomyces tritici]|uniref:futalosine hydrolase n=1 Tax=Streptomyces tritici TaxID=2054410 RepID=UPI003AF0DA61